MDLLEPNVPGATVAEWNLKNIGKFLNRILGLEVVKQNLVSISLILKNLTMFFLLLKTRLSVIGYM